MTILHGNGLSIRHRLCNMTGGRHMSPHTSGTNTKPTNKKINKKCQMNHFRYLVAPKRRLHTHICITKNEKKQQKTF